MSSSKKKLNPRVYILSKSEYFFLIFGSIVGSSALSLPNHLGKIVYQDNWISAALGAIYPLYLVFISLYLGKKFPENNILQLSKKCFGNIAGNFLNIIFFSYFFILAMSLVNDYSHMMKVFVVNFLEPIKIIVATMIFIAYAVSGGLRTVSNICKITFFLTIILILTAIPALRLGKIINVCPVFQAGLKDIFKGAVESVFAYSGVEVIFLFYPLVSKKNGYAKASILPIIFSAIIYVWVAFITTFYLSPDILVKSDWSFLLVTESLSVTVINNYRYVFIFIWSLIIFKGISIFCYSSIYAIKDFFKKIYIKKLIYLICVLVILICFKYGKKMTITNFSYKVVKVYSLFTILYVTVIAMIVFMKTRKRL